MFNAVRFNDQLYYQSSLLKSESGLVHAFSTRIGGVSPAPYASLNLGLSSGDLESNVIRNRQRFFRMLNIDVTRMASGEQIHGSRIRIITEPGQFKETDGMICQRKRVALVIKTADCAPVLLYDSKRWLIAAIHVGWRSLLQNILTRAVRLMIENFASCPADILCAVGPSIQSWCFEVQHDVADQFPAAMIVHREGRMYLNLQKMIQRQLLAEGILERNIDICHLCSCCNRDKFYSFRRDGARTGRMMMAVYVA
jgi:YfiH family protein